MKKKAGLEEDGEQKHEILKAVAQAWHSHSGSCRPLNEFDARRRNFKNKPTRFRLQAMNKLSSTHAAIKPNWDFKQSLWDSYEIVAVSKRLETGLVLDNYYDPFEETSQVHGRKKESKSSLRNLFNLASRRFKEADVPREENAQF